MKAKPPTAARKPAAKAKKPATRKAKAPPRAPRRPAKKKRAALKKVSAKKPRKISKVKPPARAKVKRAAKTVRAKAKKKTATQIVAKRRPVARRIIKLPLFLRRPARKIVVRPVPRTTPVAPPIAPAPEDATLIQSAAPPAVRAPGKSSRRRKTSKERIAAVISKTTVAPVAPAEIPKHHQNLRSRTADIRAGQLPAHDHFQLPAILFEGDHPAPPLSPAVGATSLPEAYGTQRVTVTARDPHWLCVHWDLTREQLRHHNAQSVHRHLVLRVLEHPAPGEASGEIHVHPESRHWFVHVPQAATTHVVELGYYRKHNGWVRLGVSPPTATPAAVTATDQNVRFATIPHNIALPQLAKIARSVAGKTLPLVDAIEAWQNTGDPKLTTTPGRSSSSPLPPEGERALLELIRKQHPSFGAADSAGITGLLQRELPENLSSLAGLGGISSISSPQGCAPDGPGGFWFNINAELIIYGATEPTASVTIAGRPVKLRPDGSFSHRFALPDGQYELPVTAVSADGTEARHADLKFSRNTEIVGDVGQHPQDPALKTPTPENTLATD